MNSSESEKARSTNSLQNEHGLSLSNPRKKVAINGKLSQKKKNFFYKPSKRKV